MSTKSTLFLTNDNEHFYQEGDTLVLEMSKKNINILIDDDDDLVIEIINPESELYKNMLKMRE